MKQQPKENVEYYAQDLNKVYQKQKEKEKDLKRMG